MGDADEFRPPAERNKYLPVLEPDRARSLEARRGEAHEFVEENAAIRVASALWHKVETTVSCGIIIPQTNSGDTCSHASGHGKRKAAILDAPKGCLKRADCVEKVRFSDRSQLSRPLRRFEVFWLGLGLQRWSPVYELSRLATRSSTAGPSGRGDKTIFRREADSGVFQHNRR